MAQLTGLRIFNALSGLLGALDSTDTLLLKRILGVRFKQKLEMRDGGVLATTVHATPFYTNDSGVSVKVVSATLVCPVTVTPGATANVVVLLDKVDALGTNAATIASYTSDVAGGTATAFIPKALTVVGGTSTVATLATGWVLRASATKGSTGIGIGATSSPAVLEVTMEYDV